MKSYPEIDRLKSIYHSHKISIKQLKKINSDGFVFADITIGSNSWQIYVDDEYEDFYENKPLVALYLILFSLEVYHDSLDYLDWCKQNNLNSSELKWLSYYKSLEKTYSEIKTILGDMDPCISSLDYQMRTGIIDALIASKL